MSVKRFCSCCGKKTGHEKFTDLLGLGERSGFAERLFFGVISMGASEVMADRYIECDECGKVTKQ